LTIEPTSRSVLSEIRISPPADDHLAGVDADAHLDLRQSPLPISRVQAAHGLLHGHRAREGALGVVRRRCGRPEDDEDAVAHDLVDGSAVPEDQVHHGLEIVVQEPDGLLRREPLGQGVKPLRSDIITVTRRSDGTKVRFSRRRWSA
jgi:hypothetical protein